MTIVLFIKFGLFVTIATMPIFVGALIFPSSSDLFFSWLGAVLNYAIQTATVAIALLFRRRPARARIEKRHDVAAADILAVYLVQPDAFR
jgi:undecaprenyl pyrophosphate phosphatase UppP